MKEFFTIDEAAAWLSKRSEDDFSKVDVLRANEEGLAPIYFEYKGTLGIFSDYSGPNSWLFPKPKHRIYFKGILKSQRPCERGVEVTCSRFLKKIISGVPRNYVESKTTKLDLLRPHKVEVGSVIYSDPDMSTLNTFGTFWGRVRESDGCLDSTTAIPESEWLFHVSDLRVIAGLPQTEQQTAEFHATPASGPAPTAAASLASSATTLVQETQPRGQIDQQAGASPAAAPGEAPTLQAVMELPVSQQQADESGLSKREKQIRAIEAAAVKQGYDVLSIPAKGKKILMEQCQKSNQDLFGSGPDPFKDAWKIAVCSTPPRLRMADHNKFARRYGKNTPHP